MSTDDTPEPDASPLAGFPVTVDVRVAWGDMDAYGHVNNTVFFRYFEDARICYFEEIGLAEHMREHGEGPILAKTECVFRRPLHYPDTVAVGARVSALDRDRFTMDYRIVSRSQSAVAAEGSGRIVMLDYETHDKIPVPAPIRGAIEALKDG